MKIISRFAILCVVVLAFILPVAAQTDTFTVTASVLNLRTGHGIEYPVVGQAYRGAIYPIIAYSPTANWVHLDLGTGQSAWAFVHLGEVAHFSNTVVPSTNFGTGGAVINAPSTITVTTNNANLGQGGGFLPPTTVVTYTNAMSIEEFNATIGVTASVRMRTGAGLDYNVVWIIPYGERATPLARSRTGTWILVNYEGREGWVYFEYVAAPPAIDLTALPVR